MAGIGFRLRALLSRDTLAGTIQGYLYSAVLVSGPWLFPVIALSILGTLSRTVLPAQDHDLLFSTFVHGFAWSLILAGFGQMVISRYIADKLYVREYEAVVPVVTSVLALFSTLATAIATLFLVAHNVELRFGLIATGFFVATTLVWLVMPVLSAARDYRMIAVIFLVSSTAGATLAHLLGMRYGLDGYLGGFTVGQALLLFLLVGRIVVEFPSRFEWDQETFVSFARYWDLAIIGGLYNVGIWIDKIVFWYAGPAKDIGGLLPAYPPYENCTFLSYLTIVPALSLFFIRVETAFYLQYRDLFGDILHGQTLETIELRKEGLVRSLQVGAERLIVVQGIVTLVAILLTPYAADWLGYDWPQIPMLRLSIAGAFAHMLFMLVCIVLLYFDQRHRALMLCGGFCIANALLTWISVKIGYAAYGLGYTIACVGSAAVGYAMLDNVIANLEYLTFMSQPIVVADIERR